MCALHLTHPSAHTQQWVVNKHTHTHTHTHTPGAVGSQCCGARGAVGGLVPCSRVSPQLWYWGWRNRWTFTPPTYNPCRTWDSNLQPSGYKSDSLTIRPPLPPKLTSCEAKSCVFVRNKSSIHQLYHTRNKHLGWPKDEQIFILNVIFVYCLTDCIFLFVCFFFLLSFYIYIYREREKKKERNKQKSICLFVSLFFLFYICLQTINIYIYIYILYL